MIVWSPGMSLESVEERVIQAAISFYKDEKRAADSLKLSPKDFEKKIKKYQNECKKVEELKELERQKHNDFVLRSRGMNNTI